MGLSLGATDALCSFLTLTAQKNDGVSEAPLHFPSWETFEAVLLLLRELAKVVVPESLNWNPIQLYDAMAAGEAINYSRSGYAKHRLQFGPIPGKPSPTPCSSPVVPTRKVTTRFIKAKPVTAPPGKTLQPTR